MVWNSFDAVGSDEMSRGGLVWDRDGGPHWSDLVRLV